MQGFSGGAPRRSEHELVAALAEAGTLEDAAPRVLRQLGREHGWAVASIWIVDGDLLRPVASWDAGAPGLDVFRRVSARLTFAAGAGLPGRVWERGEPVWVADLADDEDFPRTSAAAGAGLHAAAAVPLIGPAGTIGVLELFAHEPRPRDEDHLSFLALAGRQLALYMTRLDAEERLRASEEHNEQIAGAALDCIITMDHEGVVLGFNPAAEETFGYSREEAVGRRLAELIIPPDLREAHETALRRYVRDGRATILNQRLELLGRRADGAELPVELTVTRLGPREPPVFAGFLRDITARKREEAERSDLLGREQAARARAEEAERDARRIAEVLQRSLLPPHLPDIPGMHLGSAYWPGVEGTDVGGDTYDVFELGDGSWGFMIADVRGKGADAATVTALVRHTVRAAAVRTRTPSDVLRVVNEVLLRDSDGELCTAVYGRLEPGPPVATCLAVAGHPLPLVLRAGGEVDEAGAPGTLLGATPDPAIADVEVTLEPGDALVLYTDGVPDCRVAGGRFGDERLLGVLGACRGLGAAEIARRIEDETAAARLPGTGDDVAVLVLRA